MCFAMCCVCVFVILFHFVFWNEYVDSRWQPGFLKLKQGRKINNEKLKTEEKQKRKQKTILKICAGLWTYKLFVCVVCVYVLLLYLFQFCPLLFLDMTMLHQSFWKKDEGEKLTMFLEENCSFDWGGGVLCWVLTYKLLVCGVCVCVFVSLSFSFSLFCFFVLSLSSLLQKQDIAATAKTYIGGEMFHFRPAHVRCKEVQARLAKMVLKRKAHKRTQET